MKNRRNWVKYIVICLVGLLYLESDFLMVHAANTMLPKAAYNIQVSLRKKSELVVTDDGYMRIYYDGTKIGIEYYDESFQIQSKKFLEMELNTWGGFYASEDAYYIVEGQSNTAESDTAEVIRVIRYDKNWNRIGAAKITGDPDRFGGQVRYPFDYGCVEMTECNGMLYIVTGHEGYVDPAYNQGHQGFLMIAVDEATMTGEIVDCDLWHSFAQYIKCKDSNLYVLEQSEGSRFTKLTKYNEGNLQGTSIPVLKYGGDHTSAWAIPCYATVDSMALSADNVLCLGTSIDQSQYDEVSSATSFNLYLTLTPMNSFTEEDTTIKWLTDYVDDGTGFYGAELTKINDNRFMVSWEEDNDAGTIEDNDLLSSHVLHYIFIDGNGNKLSEEYTAAAPISDCNPIVHHNKLVYYASNDGMVNFYTIDANTGAFDKKCYQLAGENSTWELKDGILTVSGSGAVDATAWRIIRDKVQKIIIKTGINSLSDDVFENFDTLTEVVVEEGLESIGNNTFYNCDALAKITIPASVTSIGTGILDTGWFWIGSGAPVIRAKIYAPANSYAIEYAKQNNISYEINGDAKEDLDDTEIDDGVGDPDMDGNETAQENNQNSKDNSVISDVNSGATYKVNPSDDGNQTVVMTQYSGQAKKIVIPAEIKANGLSYKVTAIADGAFQNNKVLTEVIIGDNIQEIGKNAFAGCTKLKKVTFGKNVRSIGNKAFYNCKKLKKVTISAKVTKIGTSAFKNCKNMESVKIGKSVKTIQKEAFRGCGKLKSITIQSKKLKTVGKNVFKGIKSDAKIKVPSSKVKEYKKRLKNKGQGKNVTISK